ncbi:hypothetical protein BN961_02137 [Afipia felis]|uniref:Uncharacterized protein n=1 Tax=Afipia felis TaxID=1035 RepID=A0A090MSX0_AFIFE|nr:hypothetical protein [Afipia felis]CEG08719.1 hypothetical protein BN961_02137 [Afipia felis]
MTTAPTIPEMPGQNVGVDFGQSQVNPAWYGYLAGLRKLYDYVKTLQPLGDIVFPHDDTKSDVTRAINAQTGTTYTFVLTDAGKICEFANASAVTVTIPPNSSVAFPIGTQIDIVQAGAGKVTLAGGSGVTIKSVSSQKSLSAQEAGATLYKRDTDIWSLGGSIAT